MHNRQHVAVFRGVVFCCVQQKQKSIYNTTDLFKKSCL